MVNEVILLLPLPLPETHAQQVYCKFGVIKRQYLLGSTVSLWTVVQAGQVFKIAVKLLYLLKELPNLDSIGLFEGVGDVIFHRLAHIVKKHIQQVEGPAMEE